MTNNQKEAISILNRLRNITYTNSVSVITEEEYYLLLEYIVPDKMEVITNQLTHSVTKTSDKGWSEEDDEIFGRIHYACVMFYDDEDTTLVNWLNAIKRKLKGE